MGDARRIGWALAVAATLSPLAACSLAIDFDGLDDGPPDAQPGDAAPREGGASTDGGAHPASDGSTVG